MGNSDVIHSNCDNIKLNCNLVKNSNDNVNILYDTFNDNSDLSVSAEPTFNTGSHRLPLSVSNSFNNVSGEIFTVHDVM